MLYLFFYRMVGERYKFSLLKRKEFLGFDAKSTKDYFKKWGLTRSSLQVYSYNEYFDVKIKDQFVQAFFMDTNVKNTFKTFSSADLLGNMDIEFEKVNVEMIPVHVMSTNFFDRLYQNLLVRECGAIKKCFDEVVDDFLVSDELRKVILVEDSEFFNIFTYEDREEFIFRIFSHLVLGGYCCQYEDNVNGYTETTKHLYKDLLHVCKDKNSNQLFIQSIVLKIRLLDNKGDIVFPGRSSNVQNFCYMIIDPETRQIIIWHHIWSL